MFRQAVAGCPSQVWVSGEHPRCFWRVAYHALAYFHLYLYESLDSWPAWEKHRQECTYLEGNVAAAEPYSQQEMLEFIDLIDSQLEPRVMAMDLEGETSGFRWYPKVSRVELALLSLRHLHGHLGQLHELLLAQGVDVEWIGPAPENRV